MPVIYHLPRLAMPRKAQRRPSAGARHVLRHVVTVCVVYITVAAFLVTSFPVLAAPNAGARSPAASSVPAASTPPSSATASAPTITMEECRDLNDPQVRQRVRDLTQTALNGELARINFKELVDKQWLTAHMNERLDIEIDDAVRVLRADSNILERAYSNVSREAAEKIAVAVAERTFASEGFKIGLSDVATGVGNEFGVRIENAAGRVAEPLITCVRSALQTRYGSAVAEIFTKETEDNINVDPQAGSAKIAKSDLAIRGAGAISGIVLIVSRRVVARMAMNLGRRVAGAVASRLAATLVGLLGLALLVNDLVEAAEGVFPIVADRMKSDDAKTLVKDEIAKSIETDLREQTGQIADETADRIYSFWLDFKQKYDGLLSLAEKNAAFAAFLKDRRIEQLGRLGRLVGLLRGLEGEEGVYRRVNDGSLSRALFDLDDTGVSLAVATKSLDQALAWSQLAGSKLAKAVEYGLPQNVKPGDLTETQLSGILSFEDRNKALRVALLDRTARDAILSLPSSSLKNLTRRLSADEIGALGVYQSRLEPAVAAKILRAVNDEPGVMRGLASEAMQNAILTSRDQLTAVSMLLRDNTALNFSHISGDFAAVSDGRVHYRIFLQRYWVGILVVLFMMVLTLLWLRRSFGGRRQTIVVKADGGKR